MGQHIYKIRHQGKVPVTIRAGWDRPLQQFFMVVELDDERYHTEENNGLLYSNLDDDAASDCQDFKYFEQKLANYDLVLPVAMAKAVRYDMIMNEPVLGDVTYS